MVGTVQPRKQSLKRYKATIEYADDVKTIPIQEVSIEGALWDLRTFHLDELRDAIFVSVEPWPDAGA